MPYEDTDWTTADDTAKDTAQHFWTDSDGAHISIVPGSADYGQNMLLRADGLRLRYGTTENAKFLDYMAQIGNNGTSHMEIYAAGMNMWIGYTDTSDVYQLIEALHMYFNQTQTNAYAHIDAPSSGLWLQGGDGNITVASTDGDANAEVVLRGGNMTVRDQDGNQLWKGTAQQLADALNAPKVYAGSVVKTVSGTNGQLWTKAAFESTFNTTNAQLCGVMISNGEAGSLSAVVSAEYWSSGSNPGWFAKWTNSVSSGARRFNYIVVVPTSVQA